MTLNDFIEDTIYNVSEHVGDFRYDLSRWLEDHGVPVILTTELEYVDRAWYAVRYCNKVGDRNPIKELANCFDVFGGLRGTYLELSHAIEDVRAGKSYQYWLTRR